MMPEEITYDSDEDILQDDSEVEFPEMEEDEDE
jgi:hypothetical protein